MDMMEAARQLGKAIQADKRYLAFYAAKDANDADEALQELIGRFNLLKMQIDLCIAGEDPDTCEPAEGCTGSCSSCGGCH